MKLLERLREIIEMGQRVARGRHTREPEFRKDNYASITAYCWSVPLSHDLSLPIVIVRNSRDIRKSVPRTH